jgi:sugar phosphate isomerase/epimerase
MPAIPTRSLALVAAFVGSLEQKEAILRVVGATRAQGGLCLDSSHCWLRTRASR